MANVLPPSAMSATPVMQSVPSGTVLFRVHQTRFDAASFNPVPGHRYYGGGRFDGTHDDDYPFIYAGETVEVAVAETLLRDLPVAAGGPRVLPKAKLTGRRISAVRTRVDLEVVGLRTGAELGAVSQDTWLTMCDPGDYAQSRHWGHWIRSHVPGAHGFVWCSKREPGSLAYVLFGDRMPVTDPLETVVHASVPRGAAAAFDRPSGDRELRRRLAAYNVALSPL